MPVHPDKEFALHSDYRTYALAWEKCSDAFEGEDQVKRKKTRYLPRLTGQKLNSNGETEYAAYLNRAVWFGATGRTITGLTGTILRKPPKTEFPDEKILEAIGSRDEPLLGMLHATVQALLKNGRIGLLVDAGKKGEGADNPRPYVTSYAAQDILNWHQEQVEGRLVTVLVVLHEVVFEDSSHEIYAKEEIEQWRVLRLGTDAAFNVEKSKELKQVVFNEGFSKSDIENPFYFQEVWRKEKDVSGQETGKLIIVDTVTPTKTGSRFWDEIPFVFCNASSLLPGVEKPPLLDLVNVNFGHWRNGADLEHGRHFTCLPTPFGFGFDPKQELRIGSGVAWLSTEKDGKVGMLEFSGKGLGHLREGMEDKKKEMAVLGSRLLEDQKTGVEAAEAVKLRLSADNSTLTNISIVTSTAWTQLLQWIWEWMNSTENAEISVLMNLDFNPKKLSSDEMKTLFLLLQGGGISWESYIWNLSTGEVLPPGRTREEEEAGIEEGPPESAALGGLTEPTQITNVNSNREDENTDHEDDDGR